MCVAFRFSNSLLSKKIEQLFRIESKLGFFPGHVHLHQDFRDHSGLLGFRINQVEQPDGIHALDKGCLSNQLANFIGLKMSYEVPTYIMRAESWLSPRAPEPGFRQTYAVRHRKLPL